MNFFWFYLASFRKGVSKKNGRARTRGRGRGDEGGAGLGGVEERRETRYRHNEL